jgi:hypothetical protein
MASGCTRDEWINVFGIALAICGELSWVNLVSPRALCLVPLTGFPGFVWPIAAGFALPTTIERVVVADRGVRIVRGQVA